MSKGVRGPNFYLRLAERHARMEGFAVSHFGARFGEANEALTTYLELRESTPTGEETSGLSHSSEGLVLLHVLEVAADGEPRGGVTLLHGAGDHGGRYLDTANQLAEGSWAVALPDMRGHGRSEGERGHSNGSREIVRDLQAVQDHLAYRLPTAPKVLVGQGLGALYATTFALEQRGSVAALCLLSPLLDPQFELPKAGGLMKMFKKPGPSSPGRAGISPEALTSDSAAQAAWRSDELVHDVITLRAAEQAVEMAASCRSRLAEVGVPVLVIVGADDPLADPAGARALAGEGIEVRVKDGLRHDLLHGPASAEVAAEIRDWLDEVVR